MSRSLQASWAFLSVSAMRCVNSSLRVCTVELSSFRLITSLQNTFRQLSHHTSLQLPWWHAQQYDTDSFLPQQKQQVKNGSMSLVHINLTIRSDCLCDLQRYKYLESWSPLCLNLNVFTVQMRFQFINLFTFLNLSKYYDRSVCNADLRWHSEFVYTRTFRQQTITPNQIFKKNNSFQLKNQFCDHDEQNKH